MSSNATRTAARRVLGKTIARVGLNPRNDGRGGVCYEPVFHFSDGSRVHFRTRETEAAPSVELAFYRAPRRVES